jgi:hypothetical protein
MKKLPNEDPQTRRKHSHEMGALPNAPKKAPA